MARKQTKPPTGRAPRAQREIRDPATIRALADPARFAILGAITWGGAGTIREVAERIGRRPGSLYRHFEVLEELGLISRVGTVATARRDARVYEARPVPRMVYDPDEPEVVDAISAVVASASRSAARGFARAARAGATTRGPTRDTYMARVSGWLTAADLARFNATLDELLGFLGGRARREDARLIETTLVMCPGPDPATPRRRTKP